MPIYKPSKLKDKIYLQEETTSFKEYAVSVETKTINEFKGQCSIIGPAL